MICLRHVLFFGFFIAIQCHPVWDTSLIDGSAPSFDVPTDEELIMPADQRGILDFIDRVISGAVVISCATRQGLKGKCNVGSCATLATGEASTPCPGRFSSFLKCCPAEKHAEVVPTKVEGTENEICDLF